MSTAVLLYLSPLLFGVEMSFLVLPGTTTVFIATWLYMDATPPRSNTPAQEAPSLQPSERTLVGEILYLLSPNGRLRHIGLGAATCFTLLIISQLTAWETRNSASLREEVLTPVEPVMNVTQPVVAVLESPFKNTMAYVRWNSKHEERIPLIQNGYEPFFKTMHYSMPGINGDGPQEWGNLTHDAWEDGFWGYRAVKNTMQTILDETTEDELTGMLFYHFDVWVDPMGFAEMDFEKVWFPDSTEPKFLCMQNTARYNEWWGWSVGFHEKALQATRFAANIHDKYTIDPEEFCVG